MAQESIKLEDDVIDLLRTLSKGTGKAQGRIVTELVMDAARWYHGGMSHRTELMKELSPAKRRRKGAR